jgi:hypothetical protein
MAVWTKDADGQPRRRIVNGGLWMVYWFLTRFSEEKTDNMRATSLCLRIAFCAARLTAAWHGHVSRIARAAPCIAAMAARKQVIVLTTSASSRTRTRLWQQHIFQRMFCA